MKQMTIKTNDKSESQTIQAAVLRAGGTAKLKSDFRFLFISSEGKLQGSNDPVSYQKRIEYDISVYDCIAYLESLVDQEPFLNRSGINGKVSWGIDQLIKDQFVSMCSHQGYKPEKRLENLIAADIKMRIQGRDLLSSLDI